MRSEEFEQFAVAAQREARAHSGFSWDAHSVEGGFILESEYPIRIGYLPRLYPGTPYVLLYRATLTVIATACALDLALIFAEVLMWGQMELSLAETSPSESPSTQ